MRKTNKQSTRLADDKKGVILITILFIVAVALIFITTSLMISISARQRDYSNAKSDQARLTVTSLSQSVWQAIYAQQITDAQLESMAASGATITFNCSDMPGMMEHTDSEASAYFYYPSATDTSKIAIEFKCRIGTETQYYTMVLKKNSSEGTPAPMFNLTVNLGEAGMLNRCNFGVDVNRLGPNTNADQQNPYITPNNDNVMFIHGTTAPTTSNTAASGFYCRVIFDGVAYLRDATFNDNVYFVGENAGLDWTTTSQFNIAANGNRGNMYFWGTRAPFYTTSGGTAVPRTGAGTDSLTMSTIENIYFDSRALDATGTGIQLNTSYTGFDQFNYTNPNDDFGVNGHVFYETGSVTAPALQGSWQSFGTGTDETPSSFLNKYLKYDPDQMDTITEVQAAYCGHTATALSLSATELPSGSYFSISGGTLDHIIDCSTDGEVVIYVNGKLDICNGNGQAAGFSFESGTGHVIFIIQGSGQIRLVGGNASNDANPGESDAGKSYACGFIDATCFDSIDSDFQHVSITDLNQTTIPHFYIYATTTSASLGTPIVYSEWYTDYSGFYPSSENGHDGNRLFVYNGPGTVYYGRIAAGGLDVPQGSGGNLNVPYCPKIPGGLPLRSEAYRDNTDYSVVADECFYFTA